MFSQSTFVHSQISQIEKTLRELSLFRGGGGGCPQSLGGRMDFTTGVTGQIFEQNSNLFGNLGPMFHWMSLRMLLLVVYAQHPLSGL